MRDIDQREWLDDRRFGQRLLESLSNRAFLSCLVILHKAGRQSPEPKSGFDRSFTKQYFILPFGDTSDDDSWIFIMDVIASATHGSR